MSDYILQCIDCHKQFTPSRDLYLCSACGGVVHKGKSLKGVLRIIYDYSSLKRKIKSRGLIDHKQSGIGRFQKILPLDDINLLPYLLPYNTPLRSAMNLGAKLGLKNLLLKDDTVLPTCSFKDRASQLVVAKGLEYGVKKIICASTGNAASSVAAIAAGVGLKCVIVVPKGAPKAKLVQIAITGAELRLVDGTYDDAYDMAILETKKHGWYNRNTAYNPYTIEGKKSAALEIWEDLDFTAPDSVVIPTGDGCILAGIEKGFSDLLSLNLIDRMPRLIAVQAQHSNAIARAFEKGLDDVEPLKSAKSIADSIVVNAPRNGRWALGALKKSHGIVVTVTDDEILDAMKRLASTTGIFAEPAASASLAGIIKLVDENMISNDEKIVLLLTGHGLKDIKSAEMAVK